MRFYHASKDPHISETVIYPRVPKSRLKNEDEAVTRICVSASILGCLSAIPALQEKERVFIYSCDTEDFMQPTEEEVEDVAYTGEVWLTAATKIEYYAELEIKKVIPTVVDHFELPLYIYDIVDK